MGVVTTTFMWFYVGSHQPSKHSVWQSIIRVGPSTTRGIPPLWGSCQVEKARRKASTRRGCTCKPEALGPLPSGMLHPQRVRQQCSCLWLPVKSIFEREKSRRNRMKEKLPTEFCSLDSESPLLSPPCTKTAVLWAIKRGWKINNLCITLSPLYFVQNSVTKEMIKDFIWRF